MKNPGSRTRSSIGARAGLALVLLTAAPARGDDLRDALELAYKSNPTLMATRADLRAIDEQVPIEKSFGRPSIDGTGQYTEFVRKSANSFSSPDRAFNGNLTLSVPIYQGGAVRNRVRAAVTRVDAGRANLRATESSLFSQVVAAYMDVIQNEAIVGLNRNNVQVLDVNLQATSDRYEIGDLTRTDVAQSQSRLAIARSDTRSAEANLVSARENYIKLVGKPAESLQPPPPLPNLPATPQDAVGAALDYNPDILAARQRSRAADFDINVTGASRLPRVEVFTGGAYNDYFGTLGGGSSNIFAQSEKTAQVGVSGHQSRSTRADCPQRSAARHRSARVRRSKTKSRSSVT